MASPAGGAGGPSEPPAAPVSASAGGASFDPSPDALFDVAVADAPNTLGGLKGDVEPAHPSVLGHLISSLMPGQDLSRVTIPPFFLEPRSLLERMADMLMHPELLLEAAAFEDPVARMQGMLKWYLSGFHYKTTGVKKPFNPVVGETFACFWKHANGSRSQFYAEQIGHRPPISGIYFENRAANISATAQVWTKSQFNAPQTVKSILEGGCYLTLGGHGGETYYFTFPTYYGSGLIMGTLRMEIGDSATIVCEKTGLRADINFLLRTMFGSADRANGLEGVIKRMPAGPGAAAKTTGGSWFGGSAKPEGEPIFSFKGNWDSQVHISPVAAGGGAAAAGSEKLFLDVATLVVSPKYVLPISLQGPWESRRLWQFASVELLKRPAVKWEQVDREKGQLEEEQRLVPCHLKEKAPGFRPWATKKFHQAAITNPLTGKEVSMYLFDARAAIGRGFGAGEEGTNLLALSRTLPDCRGGLRGAGAEPELVASMKTIKLSAARAGPGGWEA